MEPNNQKEKQSTNYYFVIVTTMELELMRYLFCIDFF